MWSVGVYYEPTIRDVLVLIFQNGFECFRRRVGLSKFFVRGKFFNYVSNVSYLSVIRFVATSQASFSFLLQEVEVPELVLPDRLKECPGLPRYKWNTKFVTLFNDEGGIVAEGICQSIGSEFLLDSDDEPIREDQVLVQIVNCINLDYVPADSIFGSRKWSLSHAIHNGWSLRDHLQRD